MAGTRIPGRRENDFRAVRDQSGLEQRLQGKGRAIEVCAPSVGCGVSNLEQPLAMAAGL
jgi:hypothetical protein